MKYYTIQNNNILIAENEQALSNYYNKFFVNIQLIIFYLLNFN